MNNNNEYYMTPKGRTNNLIPSQLGYNNNINSIINNSIIHVFKNPSILSPPISQLKTQSYKRNIQLIIHSNPNQLYTLLQSNHINHNNTTNNNKTFIVIQTARQSATQLSVVFNEQFQFPKINSNDMNNIKIVTYPGKMNNTPINYLHAKDKTQLFNIYDQFTGININYNLNNNNNQYNNNNYTNQDNYTNNQNNTDNQYGNNSPNQYTNNPNIQYTNNSNNQYANNNNTNQYTNNNTAQNTNIYTNSHNNNNQRNNSSSSVNKIKLRKIHSSKDIKYELASPQSIKSPIKNKNNKEIIFTKLLYTDYKIHPDTQFKLLTQSIKRTPNISPLLHPHDLKPYIDSITLLNKSNKQNNKLLLLLDQKNIKQWRQYIQKNKYTNQIQLMVLGDLKPSKQLLKSNVYFASDNGKQILNQLQKLKFQQVQSCRSEFIKLSTANKNLYHFSQQQIKITPYSNNYNYNTNNISSSAKVIGQSSPKKDFQSHHNKQHQRQQLHRLSQQFSASIFSNASSQFQRYMRNWIVDIDPNIKNKQQAPYLTIQQQGKQHIDGPSQPMSKRASRITLRRNSSQSSQDYYGPTNNLVDQYQRIKNKDGSGTTVNIPMPNDLQFNKLHNSHKQIVFPPPQSTTIIQQKSPVGNKKIIQIMKKSSVQNKHQTKHQQLPSNVIQQTSQQYRGSNHDHFYHYSQGQVGGSGNQLGGSGNQLSGSNGHVVSPSNFSKVKNLALQPAQQLGNKRTVYQQQNYPSVRRVEDIGFNQRNGYQSEQSYPAVKRYDDIGFDQKNGYNYPPIKKINDIGFNETNGYPPTKRIQDIGFNQNNRFQQDRNYPDVKKFDDNGFNQNNGYQKQLLPIQSPSHSQINTKQQTNNRSVTNNLLPKPNDTVARSNLLSDFSRPFIIDGLTGQLQRDSSRRLQQLITVSYSQANQVIPISKPSQQQVLRPSHYIQPQIVKIPYDSNGNLNSKQSIATQKKINNTNYNVINGNSIESTTSIRGANQRIYIPSPTNNTITQNFASTSNYKVYTPEEYANRYETGNKITNVNTKLASGPNKNYVSSSTTNYYQSSSTNNYQSTTNANNKQPQVINRVYIKANDLPQRQTIVSGNYTTTAKRYQTSPTYAKDTLTQDYRTKLSVEDTDPFNERTPSKNSSMRKGSYLMRRQDGKRDPYSPYQQNGSILNNQKSGVKVYTSEQYQKVVDGRKLGSPIKQSSNSIDLSKYDRVVQNGVAVYKPKNQNRNIEPNRENYHQSKVTVVNGYQSNGVTRYEPTGRDYANSPTKRQGSSYQKGLKSENPLRRTSQQSYESHNVVPLRDQRIRPLVYDSKSPMKVSQYRTNQPKVQAYTYNSPTRHVYERRQIVEPRVQASNFNPRIDNKLPENQIGIISGIQHKNSEIFQLSDGSIMRRNNIKFGINKYRAPQGNQKIDESFEYLEQMKSRIQSKIINLSEINRNFSIEKKLSNQQQIQSQKQAYSYINTYVNEFYFLIDDELGHLSIWISKYMKSRNDKVEVFRGMQELYEEMRAQKVTQQFDVTFIFVKSEDVAKINKKLVPQNCFIVDILNEDFKGLQVSERQKKIRLSKLPYLKLAQKIILETMLTHIILYQRATTVKKQVEYFNKEVSHILSLFPEGQFIKQPYDSPLSLQLINGLIQDPKFSRLYIICNQKQMTNVVDKLGKIAEQSGIPEQICKIICIPSDNQILRHQDKIQSYPRVAWMTNSSKIQDYKSLIKYALRQEQDDNLYTKPELEEKQKIFYHTRHRNLNNLIEKEFPSRFEFQAFNSLNEVEKKILKAKTDKVKQNMSPKKPGVKHKISNQTTVNYLILHPILSDEYIDIKLFKKIFMLGKSDKTQRKVMKVSSNEELIELLKK